MFHTYIKARLLCVGMSVMTTECVGMSVMTTDIPILIKL